MWVQACYARVLSVYSRCITKLISQQRYTLNATVTFSLTKSSPKTVIEKDTSALNHYTSDDMIALVMGNKLQLKVLILRR